MHYLPNREIKKSTCHFQIKKSSSHFRKTNWLFQCFQKRTKHNSKLSWNVTKPLSFIIYFSHGAWRQYRMTSDYQCELWFWNKEQIRMYICYNAKCVLWIHSTVLRTLIYCEVYQRTLNKFGAKENTPYELEHLTHNNPNLGHNIPSIGIQ